MVGWLDGWMVGWYRNFRVHSETKWTQELGISYEGQEKVKRKPVAGAIKNDNQLEETRSL